MLRIRISPNVSIFPHSKNGVYYAAINRKPLREKVISLGTKSREEAETRVKDSSIEAIAAHRKTNTLTQAVASVLIHDRKLSCRDAAEEAYAAMELGGLKLKSMIETKAEFNRFLKTQNLEALPPSAIERVNVDAFINNGGASSYSRRKRVLSYLRAVLTAMVNLGHISTNPAEGIRVRTEGMTQAQLIPTKRKPFTMEEVNLLLRHPGRGIFWRCAIMLGYETGLRLGDIAALERSNLVDDEIRVFTGKTQSIVSHKISHELRDILNSIVHEDPDEKHFWPDIELRHACWPQYLTGVFTTMLKNCGIKEPGKSFHSLRHTYAHNKLATEKADIRKSVMEELMNELALERTRLGMGHADAETTKGYLANNPVSGAALPRSL